ncbi:MAG: winged helix-turn-helix transcriptional regulator [Lachnospiraceae bacterium]|nr:winged helix-turn-helix transcriptional regulator [Lachnospiraceae bacterium]
MNGDFFEALSNPYRRQIVQMLKWKNHSVNEITAALGISQPSVSRHLDVLKHAGLVVAERRANQVIYSLNISVMQEIMGKLVEFIEDIKGIKKYDNSESAYHY